MKVEVSREMKITLISIGIAALFIFFGILARLAGEVGVMGNFIILSVFTLATPQFFFRYERFRALKEMEEKFPVFLRDVSERVRSGLPLYKAIQSCSKIDYGKLSDEIRKMSNQLSWGLPLDKVLSQFGERIKKSERLSISIQTIREAFMSGGDVPSTLDAMADNLTILEDTEKEKSSMLNQYVILIYAISIAFVGIVAAINKFMIPIFRASAPGFGVIGMENPCGSCMGFSCVICGIYEAIASIFTTNVTGIGAYYIALFFLMTMIQSFFSGLLVGQMSENSLIAGLKHSLILCFITFGMFAIMVRIGFIGV